ncbi:MAG: methyltransferase domain-containing protein [SAR324 cluster bacterium]|nr:methyltransferase domain-containing protein [SAR324 cluster bacterium]
MDDYFEYLNQRKQLSYYYRKKLLYPVYLSLLPGRGLEIGCGLGEFLQMADQFIGVDVNQDVVDFCRNQKLDVRRGTATNLPFSEDQFDSVLLDNVFEHIDQPEACLKETKRVMKQGGNLLIVVPNKKGWGMDPTHVTYWDEHNLPEIIEKAGFQVLQQRHFPLSSKKLGNWIWPYNTFYVLAKAI